MNCPFDLKAPSHCGPSNGRLMSYRKMENEAGFEWAELTAFGIRLLTVIPSECR